MDNTNSTQAEASLLAMTKEQWAKLPFAEKLKIMEATGAKHMNKSNSSGESPLGGIVIVGGIQKPKEAANEQEG